MKQDSKICTAQAQEARLVPSGGPVVAIKALACLSLILGLIGCGGGGSAACTAGLGVLASGSCPSEAANNAPTARTGSIQNVQVGTLVFLDASASTDPESSTLTYKWTLTSKPAASAADLAPSASPRPSFIADVEGIYSATLVVSDGKLSSPVASTSVVASVNNSAPVAVAGAAQSVLVGARVILDGTASTDANSDALTYKWSMIGRPTGSSALLSSSTSPVPHFTADRAGNYVISLMVNDGRVDSAVTATTVTASAATVNAVPIAKAGLAQFVSVGTRVTLDGTDSSDANSDFLTYKWSLISVPTGSAATLSSATSARPTFIADIAGVYVATLGVNDGKADSAIVATTINASAANSAPVALTSSSQNVTVASVVTLDGSGSTDADNNALTYKWTLVSKPTSSSATLSSSTAAKPTFTADLAGTYVATLIVNDGSLSSSVVATTVTASAANSAPVAVTGSSQSVTVAAVVTLDGSGSTDANYDTLSFNWTLVSKPTSSSATLSSSTAAKPTFTADVAGTYVAALIVYDGTAYSSLVATTVTASAANAAPVANAGSTQTVAVAATVTLDGTGSTDTNSDTLTYKWVMTTRPTGSSAELSSATASMPTFTADVAGIYVFTLVVNDGKVDSSNTSIVAVSAS